MCIISYFCSSSTAGLAAFFSVTARDEYKNLRQLHDDSWLAVIEVILRHRYFEILGF